MGLQARPADSGLRGGALACCGRSTVPAVAIGCDAQSAGHRRSHPALSRGKLRGKRVPCPSSGLVKGNTKKFRKERRRCRRTTGTGSGSWGWGEDHRDRLWKPGAPRPMLVSARGAGHPNWGRFSGGLTEADAEEGRNVSQQGRR